MKKIFIILVLLLFQTQLIFASEETQTKQINSMPSDEEIMEAIKSYNFDAKKEKRLFKELKKQFREMYEEQNNQNIEVNIDNNDKN